MPQHSSTSNVEWAILHELETIATALENLERHFNPRTGGQLANCFKEIEIQLKRIADKP